MYIPGSVTLAKVNIRKFSCDPSFLTRPDPDRSSTLCATHMATASERRVGQKRAHTAAEKGRAMLSYETRGRGCL